MERIQRIPRKSGGGIDVQKLVEKMIFNFHYRKCEQFRILGIDHGLLALFKKALWHKYGLRLVWMMPEIRFCRIGESVQLKKGDLLNNTIESFISGADDHTNLVVVEWDPELIALEKLENTCAGVITCCT